MHAKRNIHLVMVLREGSVLTGHCHRDFIHTPPDIDRSLTGR